MGAAIHLRHRDGSYNAGYARALLRGRNPHLLRLWRREQGILVAREDAHRVHTVTDLPPLRVALREHGAGTRVLLDQLLIEHGIDPGTVRGPEMPSHLDVALSIAAGIVAGKKLGESAHAALVTRGFAEMMRFGTALGARRETMTGLSGLGDLVLTCGSPQSRNMSLGVALGQGESLNDVLKSRVSVTEGIYTASAVMEMAAARGIDMPIAQAVHAVVSGLATVDEAIEALLARPLRAEA